MGTKLEGLEMSSASFFLLSTLGSIATYQWAEENTLGRVTAGYRDVAM